jgi:glycosyltransferase involved in cell wall biosynthesis
MNSRPQISLCMLVQNNANFLRFSLESVKPYVSEFVFVDGGSTDNTLEIASSYPNSKIVSRPWDGNHAKQRNIALEAATGDWILMLDSDEFFGANFGLFIDELTRSDIASAFAFPRYWLVETSPAKHVHSGALYPDAQLRMWRHSPNIRYQSNVENMVHERLAKPPENGSSPILVAGNIGD